MIGTTIFVRDQCLNHGLVTQIRVVFVRVTVGVRNDTVFGTEIYSLRTGSTHLSGTGSFLWSVLVLQRPVIHGLPWIYDLYPLSFDSWTDSCPSRSRFRSWGKRGCGRVRITWWNNLRSCTSLSTLPSPPILGKVVLTFDPWTRLYQLKCPQKGFSPYKRTSLLIPLWYRSS